MKENHSALLLILFFMTPVHSRINSDHQKRWYLINDDFYIDVKSFQIKPPKMNFWIKEKSYDKRRLAINCEDFTEKEIFGQKETNFNPIKLNSQKYKIAYNLCFLTNAKGYSKTFFNRQKNWVKQIIKIQENKGTINDEKETNNQSEKEYSLAQ
tara:strand:+ start:42 stop:503 length:462 start_codon:yes stop_codon:yes gene_type:complete